MTAIYIIFASRMIKNNVAIVVHYNRFCTGLRFVAQQKRHKQSVFSVTKCELLLVIRGVVVTSTRGIRLRYYRYIKHAAWHFHGSQPPIRDTDTHAMFAQRNAKRAIFAPRIFRQTRLSSFTFYLSNTADTFKCRHEMRIKRQHLELNVL